MTSERIKNSLPLVVGYARDMAWFLTSRLKFQSQLVELPPLSALITAEGRADCWKLPLDFGKSAAVLKDADSQSRPEGRFAKRGVGDMVAGISPRASGSPASSRPASSDEIVTTAAILGA